MKFLALVLLVTSIAACDPPAHSSAAFKTIPSSTQLAGPTLTLAPVIDARPRALLKSHEPNVARYTGVAMVYFMFGTGRIDGSTHPGDKDTTLSVDGSSGAVVPQMDAYLRSVVASATGTAPARGAAAEIGNVQSAARGDGVTIVPILDQFDEFRMSSEDEITGGSSYQSGNYQVTTSGYSAGRARTDNFANMRLRLVLMETRGGHVVRQATAYVATSSNDLSQALLDGAKSITTQLAAFVTNGRGIPSP